MRLKKLIERGEKQNEEVIEVIELYKEMVTFINEKIIAQSN